MTESDKTMIPRIVQSTTATARRGMTATLKKHSVGRVSSASHYEHRMISNRTIMPSYQLAMASLCAHSNSGFDDGMASAQQRCYGAVTYCGTHNILLSEDSSSNASCVSEDNDKSLCVSPTDIDDDGG